MTIFSKTCGCILNHCQGESMHTYQTTEELKTKEFTINCQNINQEIGIHVTFIFEIKLQKYVFCENMTKFKPLMCPFSNPLLGWESAHVCHNLRTEKESDCGKWWDLNEAISIQVTIMFEIKLLKWIFYQNKCATTKELKRKAFIEKSQNIKQAMGIQLAIMLKIKLQM